MKGGYKKCNILEDNRIAGLQAYCDVLKEKNCRILKENVVLKKDNDFWCKECNDYQTMYHNELDYRHKVSNEAEKYKAWFAYAGGCSIGFAILWFFEAFIF